MSTFLNDLRGAKEKILSHFAPGKHMREGLDLMGGAFRISGGAIPVDKLVDLVSHPGGGEKLIVLLGACVSTTLAVLHEREEEERLFTAAKKAKE